MKEQKIYAADVEATGLLHQLVEQGDKALSKSGTRVARVKTADPGVDEGIKPRRERKDQSRDSPGDQRAAVDQVAVDHREDQGQ